MPSSIVTENISGNDNAILMSNSQWARPIIIPSQWSTIRIGVRHQFVSASANITGTPRYAFGLCHNTANLVGDASTDYFVGVMSTGASFQWNGPGAGSVFFSVTMAPAAKTGSAIVTGTSLATDWRVGGNTSAGAYRTGWYIDITKGSPNYSFVTYYFQSGTATDLSSANFIASMTGTPQVVNGSGGTTSAAQTLAVNEALSGSLNAVTAWWNHTDSLLEITDVALAVIA